MKRSVLVVDDDRSISAAIRITLEESYQIYMAENGMDALHLLRENKPDLILLDITLPDMNGLAVLDKVKKSGLKTAVIMLTADDSVETIFKALMNGAMDYMVKPLSANELRTRLKVACERLGR